jgi:hypothetical protein
MKAFRGWTMSVGLLLAATAVNAQEVAPQDASRPGYVAASDIEGPYADVPPVAPAPVYGAPVYGPRAYGPPAYGQQVYGPQTYGPREYGNGGPPLMPPTEVYAVLRENGFSPLGAPRLRGLFYSVSAIDRRGDDGRLVIDARDGRIVRFVPASRFGDGYYDGRPDSYGYGPMTRLEGPPRPPANVPKIASRMPQSVPMPKVAPQRPADEKPLAEKSTPAPTQQSAAVQVKPATVAPAAPSMVASSAEPAKPAAVIQPTQPMPRVQGLE